MIGGNGIVDGNGHNFSLMRGDIRRGEGVTVLSNFARKYVATIFDKHGISPESSAEEYVGRHRLRQRDCDKCAAIEVCRAYVMRNEDFLCHVRDTMAGPLPDVTQKYRITFNVPESLRWWLNATGGAERRVRSAWLTQRVERYTRDGRRPVIQDVRLLGPIIATMKLAMERRYIDMLLDWGNGHATTAICSIIMDQSVLSMPATTGSRTEVHVYTQEILET